MRSGPVAGHMDLGTTAHFAVDTLLIGSIATAALLLVDLYLHLRRRPIDILFARLYAASSSRLTPLHFIGVGIAIVMVSFILFGIGDLVERWALVDISWIDPATDVFGALGFAFQAIGLALLDRIVRRGWSPLTAKRLGPGTRGT